MKLCEILAAKGDKDAQVLISEAQMGKITVESEEEAKARRKALVQRLEEERLSEKLSNQNKYQDEMKLREEARKLDEEAEKLVSAALGAIPKHVKEEDIKASFEVARKVNEELLSQADQGLSDFLSKKKQQIQEREEVQMENALWTQRKHLFLSLLGYLKELRQDCLDDPENKKNGMKVFFANWSFWKDVRDQIVKLWDIRNNQNLDIQKDIDAINSLEAKYLDEEGNRMSYDQLIGYGKDERTEIIELVRDDGFGHKEVQIFAVDKEAGFNEHRPFQKKGKPYRPSRKAEVKAKKENRKNKKNR